MPNICIRCPPKTWIQVLNARSITLPPVFLALLALPASFAAPSTTPDVGLFHDGKIAASTLDSARAEMGAGRFWHATRMLRSAGAAKGTSAEILLLARAEAGWKDWGQVRALLKDVGWLDAEDHGEGWRLLGRADEEEGRWQEAANAYGAYLAHAAPDDSMVLPTTVRHAHALARSGSDSAAVAALKALPTAAAPARSWMALDLLGPPIENGDTARVEALMALVTDESAADAAWLALPRARLSAGDTAGALTELHGIASSTTGKRRVEAGVQEGLLLIGGPHEREARALLLEGVNAAPGGFASSAAAALVDAGGNSHQTLLRLASVLDRVGDEKRALQAYDEAETEAHRAHTRLTEEDRLARARLMAMVSARRQDALQELRALYRSTASEHIGARTLQEWASLRRSEGRDADADTVEGWLLERYPSSPEAVDVLWRRAAQAEARGNPAAAVKSYASLIRRVPDRAKAGEARMRTAQIALTSGHEREAVRVYRDYLKQFPDGRRWDEASYWTARLDMQLGDTAAARHLVARIRRAEPVSYYAVVGADLLHESYDIDVPPGKPAGAAPAWMVAGLARLDLLQEAGLKRGADVQASRLVEQARTSRSALLDLAEALERRGRTVKGIGLGWELRAEGEPWTLRLLKVVYPFPYEELVRREAAEWGLNPIVLAALIRQESAFAADAVSGAGAVGLMQVMPHTGRQLARSSGPDGFDSASLTNPEVNLHLGAAFLVEMSHRYDGDLPLILAAYNAGPTRATRWRKFPEASDPLRFTERIPFDETRGYVKSVTRNLSVYRALYGDQ